MLMCGDILAAARLWRGRLLTTGRLSCRHPIIVCARRVGRVAVAGLSTWACSGRGAAICVRVFSSVSHLSLRNGHCEMLSSVAQRTVPCGLCPGCWCGGLHHQRTTSRAPLVSRPRPSDSSSCLSRPALRADGVGLLVGLIFCWRLSVEWKASCGRDVRGP